MLAVSRRTSVNFPVSIAQTLMKHPFLKALAPDQAEALSLLATPVEFRPEETIFRQREAADGFYLIETGEVGLEYELPGKRTVQIQKIGPGELLGLSWLFEPYRWEFSAIATSDVTANFLRAADVRKQCEQDPKLGYKIDGRGRQSFNRTSPGNAAQTAGVCRAGE